MWARRRDLALLFVARLSASLQLRARAPRATPRGAMWLASNLADCCREEATRALRPRRESGATRNAW